VIRISRTNSADKDFLSLVTLLDAELWQRYPEIQHLYAEHTKIDYIQTVILVYDNDIPVACGCFLIHDTNLIEIKRMYVHHQHRGKGFAKTVLTELEQWATESGYNTSILETGKNQPEAISLYKRCGYQLTNNYDPYKDLQESLCFTKTLT